MQLSLSLSLFWHTLPMRDAGGEALFYERKLAALSICTQQTAQHMSRKGPEQ